MSATGDGSTNTQIPQNFEPEHNAKIHEAFRNLSLLVTVATAINNLEDFHPRLEGPLSADEAGRLGYDGEVDPDRSVMHAVTSILVLEHEILASMSRNRAGVLVSESDPYEIVTDEEGERYAMDSIGMLKVAALANPELDRDAGPGSISDDYVLEKGGESLWPQVLADKQGYISFTHK
jgi:hypothetical protein